MKRKRRRQQRRRRILLGILLAAALAIIGFLAIRYMPSGKQKNLYDYYGIAKDEEGAVIILGELFLPERGLVEGGVSYLPLEVVKTRLNAGFYWNEDTEEIFYTLPSGTDRWPSSQEAGGDVLRREEGVYLSVGLVKRYTDLDVYLYGSPNRIVLRSEFSDLTMVTAKKKTAVRYLPSSKAEVVSRAAKGSQMVFIGEEDKWYQVATWDGYVGYVPRSSVSSPQQVTMPRSFALETCSFLTSEEPVNLGFAMVTNYDANDTVLASMSTMEGVGIICPTWFSISSENGEITDLSSSAFVEEAHQRGVKVWALVDNFSGVSTYETLRHSSSRERLEERLISACLEAGVDGLNIDFENLTYDSAPHVVQFLRELSVRTHREGLVLSFDNPPPENYTGHYERGEQAKVVDYNIIMGYDEHYQGSEFMGSVASYPWVEQAVIDSTEEFPAERTILAVPFYTRAWYEKAGAVSSEVIYMYEQDEILAVRQPEVYWNTEVHQFVATWTNEGIAYTMWMEEENSLRDKAALVGKYALAGVAFWRLGFEKDEIWPVLTEALSG